MTKNRDIPCQPGRGYPGFLPFRPEMTPYKAPEIPGFAKTEKTVYNKKIINTPLKTAFGRVCMPKASVIVPVYNIKPYLEKCVRSILDQTERDFELLLVDDGSTDGSGELCDALSEADSRIRVIHQPNGGPGAARNTGIKAACGKWILQIDGDDWIDPTLLEHTLAAGEREDADLVMFGMQMVDETGAVIGTLTEAVEKNVGLSLREHKELLLTSPATANKLYRRDLFSRAGVEYPPRMWYEDARLSPQLMAVSRTMVFLDELGYYYFQRTGSTMRNQNLDRNGEIIDTVDDIAAWFREKGLYEEYKEELCFLTFSHLYQAAVRVVRADRKHPLLPRLWQYLNDRFPRYRENKYMQTLSKKQRIVLFLLERKQYALVSAMFRVRS